MQLFQTLEADGIASHARWRRAVESSVRSIAFPCSAQHLCQRWLMIPCQAQPREHPPLAISLDDVFQGQQRHWEGLLGALLMPFSFSTFPYCLQTDRISHLHACPFLHELVASTPLQTLPAKLVAGGTSSTLSTGHQPTHASQKG
jgi:hypothetical protein